MYAISRLFCNMYVVTAMARQHEFIAILARLNNSHLLMCVPAVFLLVCMLYLPTFHPSGHVRTLGVAVSCCVVLPLLLVQYVTAGNSWAGSTDDHSLQRLSLCAVYMYASTLLRFLCGRHGVLLAAAFVLQTWHSSGHSGGRGCSPLFTLFKGRKVREETGRKEGRKNYAHS